MCLCQYGNRYIFEKKNKACEHGDAAEFTHTRPNVCAVRRSFFFTIIHCIAIQILTISCIRKNIQ